MQTSLRRLYLGLIHFDERAGDAERIARARRVILDFGIASECGRGRTDPSRLAGLLGTTGWLRRRFPGSRSARSGRSLRVRRDHPIIDGDSYRVHYDPVFSERMPKAEACGADSTGEPSWPGRRTIKS